MADMVNVNRTDMLRVTDALVKDATEIENCAIGSSRIVEYQRLAADVRQQVGKIHKILGLTS